MVQPSTWKIVAQYSSKAWGVITLVAGILIGAYIANRNQRQQWLLENKRAEYRELLTTIADAGGKFVVFYGMGPPIVATGEEQFEIGETARKSVDAIYNRLFIADDVKRLDLQRRWERAISALRRTLDINAFGKELDTIMDDVRKAALKRFS